MCRKIISHWGHFSLRKWQRRPHFFSYKIAAVASFSYKIGGGALIFLQNWRRRAGGKDLATLLEAVLNGLDIGPSVALK